MYTKMPVLFAGHGSPMNAIEENEFTKGFREAAMTIPRPKLVVCISAHWETRGTRVTAMEKPVTIHDFGGFPRELYEIQYPAPGDPELAREITHHTAGKIAEDKEWGLDHGTWSVLRHFYPDAGIPVIQISLDYQKTPRQHYELAKELAFLRKEGVLIIGSGNMVHNLRMVAWDKINTPGYGYDWALDASEKLKQLIVQRDHDALIRYGSLGKAIELAIPTPEHFLPALYILGLLDEEEPVCFFNDRAVAGSLTMTSFVSVNS